MSDIAEKVLKIDPSMFEDGKIQMLINSDNGYRDFYIWMKLLCWMKNNGSTDGSIKIGRKTLDVDGISRAIKEPFPYVLGSMGKFLDFELVDEVDGKYVIPNWNKWQNAKKEAREDKEKRFVKPTVEEVKAYCEQEKIYNVNPQEFIDYYEQANWTMGNGRKVVSWKHCVKTWVHNEEKREKIREENREYWKKLREKEQRKKQEQKDSGYDRLRFLLEGGDT